jgi:hypothetical protein
LTINSSCQEQNNCAAGPSRRLQTPPALPCATFLCRGIEVQPSRRGRGHIPWSLRAFYHLVLLGDRLKAIIDGTFAVLCILEIQKSTYANAFSTSPEKAPKYFEKTPLENRSLEKAQNQSFEVRQENTSLYTDRKTIFTDFRCWQPDYPVT